jgi:hypothetical protein
MSKIPEMQILNATTGISLAGTNASQMLYYNYAKEGRNIKTLDTILIKGNVVYLLSYRADPTNNLTYLPIAKQMIDSFQFTN